MSEDLQDVMEQLYAAPLEDFIAERKRLATELRQAGDKDRAAEVAKLAKPSPAAWALNQVAREAPDEVAAWLDVAAELRDASTRSAEVGGDALRAAMSAHRSATANLRGVVRDRAKPGGRALSDSMLDRVMAMLQVATADVGIAERLRRGTISEDATPAPAVEPPAAGRGTQAGKGAAGGAAAAGGGAAGGGAAAGGAARAAPKETAPQRRAREAADRAAAARAARVAELEERAATLREEIGQVRERLDDRKAAARAAVRRLEDARRALRRTEAEVRAAEGAVSDAEDVIAAHERELADIRDELRER